MDQLSKYINLLHLENIGIVALRIVLIIVGVWIALMILKGALRRLEKTLIHRAESEGEGAFESTKRIETLTQLLRQATVIIVWAIAALIILRELGIDIAPILASAGIVGLAVGFGAQNLVKDVISGFFLILENQVRIGDVAIINGTGGLVEKINLRTLVLRDLAGIVHVFPNGSINTLANVTHDWSAFVLDIGVAYKEDTDKVIELMKKVGGDLRKDENFGPLMIEDVEIFGVDKFGDSAVMIKGRLKTKPIKQWDVGREYLRRIKKAFDEAGIEIPFPHQSLYFGEASKPILAKLIGAAQQSE
jgi:moderate conductance mechanosensitive channel